MTEAANRGHVSLLTFLVEARGDVNAAVARNLRPLPGSPLITKAAHSGHLEIVSLLFESIPGGAPKDDQFGRTLIHTSLEWPHVAVYILQRGVDLGAKDAQGRTALHVAVEGFNKPESGRRPTCDDRSVSALLKHGAAVYARDAKLQQQPLHIAAMRGHWLCTDLLLRHGAEVDALSGNGQSAVEIATEAGHWRVVQTLVSSGGSVSKAVRRLAKKDGAAAAAWLKEHERTSQGECDILLGTCDL